jgi:demethylmenaquinone methyltransferase/2-methoxy-6-polyprenyl-1,4-benzoquinol methylase
MRPTVQRLLAIGDERLPVKEVRPDGGEPLPPESGEGRADDTAESVREMFSKIADRYDLLNTVLSLGLDRSWRREAARQALEGGATSVLDAATGTGELALELKRQRPAARVVGVDFTASMLETAARKAGRRRLDLELVNADVLALPFEDETFEAVTIAYGLRNLSDKRAGLGELSRVLKPAGRLVILEFPPPPDDALGRLFRFYFLRILPRIGGWISGSSAAYRYLPASVLAFPQPPELAALVREAGFAGVRYRLQSHGVSAILVGEKR